MKCPSEAQLNEYTVRRPRIGDIGQHLLTCPGCRRRVAELRQAAQWLDLASTADTPGEHPADEELAALAEGALARADRARVLSHVGQCAECATVLGGLRREVAGATVHVAYAAPRRSRSRTLAWGALAAAAAILIIIGGALFLRPARQVASLPPELAAVAPPADLGGAGGARQAELPPAAAGGVKPARPPEAAAPPPEIARPAAAIAQTSRRPADDRRRPSAPLRPPPSLGGRMVASATVPSDNRICAETPSALRNTTVAKTAPEAPREMLGGAGGMPAGPAMAPPVAAAQAMPGMAGGLAGPGGGVETRVAEGADSADTALPDRPEEAAAPPPAPRAMAVERAAPGAAAAGAMKAAPAAGQKAKVLAKSLRNKQKAYRGKSRRRR